MHRTQAQVILFISALLVSGCSSESVQQQPDANAEGSTPDPQAETVFDPMLESLDRAKGVEDLAAQRKAEMDERIRKETAGDSPD